MVSSTTVGTPPMLPLPIEAKRLPFTGTVVPLASKYATPRVTPYIPSVPMNGGTRRSAISSPLINPGITAMVNPAKTARIRLTSGLLKVIPQLKTWAVTTADRPIVNPTDKSIPPEIMTKVWPRANNSGVTVKTAMDFTLNGLKKNVLLYSTRAQISKVIKRIPKKSQARNAARKSSQRTRLFTVDTVLVVVVTGEEKREDRKKWVSGGALES